jgi:hypothetical protein
MLRRKVQILLSESYKVIAALAALLSEILRNVAVFLIGGSEPSKKSSSSDMAPSGGVLNYRTSKLDDGTDPIGWYERD